MGQKQSEKGGYHLIVDKIKKHLTPDLLNKQWKGSRGVEGHCYIGAEVAWHLTGKTYKPCYLNHKLWPEGLGKGETHWFLVKGEDVLDPTAEQFNLPIPYERGMGCGFLTKHPSKRARVVLDRIAEFDV